MESDRAPDYFLFIINPKAGHLDKINLAERIKSAFSSQNSKLECHVVQTEKPGQAQALAADCARQYGSRAVIFACGGDGTAREVAGGVARTDAAMGLVPIGTANDFAKTVLPGVRLDWLLPRLPGPDIRPIDVIEADGQICLNIASLGFDTKVQRQASRLNARFPWLGQFSYSLAVVLSLFGNREYPMHYQMQTIDQDGRKGEIEGDARFILAAICNGHYYGGGFNPSPHALLDDGRLDFCLVDNLPMRRIIPLIPRYKKGTHLGDPAIHLWPVVSGHIQAQKGLLLGNYDGESFEKEMIDFRILPGVLRFAFY
ncbi:MAG: diacylglycerol kinase family protein [Clostridiaceae bacterium]|nr:diacylglycerol kinase family protein [Clostridiaceae bacterium]